MRNPFAPEIIRLRVQPDDPEAVVARPKKSRRPHTGATVARVRELIEGTALTYGEIAARTGVGRASICRWTQDGKWKRPPFAPRATDTIPQARASAKLKRRTLAARLTALAERYVRELEETPGVDLDKLAEALELMKMAKLAAQGRRRRRPGANDPARAVMQLCLAGVDLHRAPREALEDFLANREPPPEEPGRRRPRRETRRNREHRWMLEKVRE